MRAIVVGDVHLSDTPPSARTETYAEDILAKLDWIVATAAEKKVDCIVINGDMFHIKTPSKTSHKLVQATAAVLNQKVAPPVLITPGNHDVQFDRMESLNRQPLGALALSPNVRLLDGDDPEFPVFGVPYLWDWSSQLPRYMARWQESSAVLMSAHAPVFPNSENPPYEHIKAFEWVNLMERSGHFTYGHIHDVHGIWKEGGTRVCNLGAISRGSLHEKTVARKPQVALYDSEKATPFEALAVPHKPAELVFRLEEVAQKKQATAKLDAFLEGVSSTSLTNLSLEQVLHHAQEQKLSPGTLKELQEILESVK
jgi:hypothetical protein